MRLKGVNYDVGTFTSKDRSSRPTFSPEVVEREMEIIAKDLHCNAVRISGRDIDRLTLAAECALRQGMEVWLSPNLTDATEPEMLTYLTQCAKAAEKLRKEWPHVIFVVGTELTLFMRGIIDNRTSLDRIANLMKPAGQVKFTLLQGVYARKLNRVLAKAAKIVWQDFQGPVTYAAGSWEKVDWSPFDYVSIDHYRDASNENTYQASFHAFSQHGKPVVITEFGCCTYQGAADKGGIGWAIINWSTNPPALVEEFRRDEREQADYISESLEVFQEENVDGAFVFTFVNPGYPTSDDPDYDLDMASYSLVKTYADQHGKTYPEMPWEPKQSFRRVAEIYAVIVGELSAPKQPLTSGE